MRLLWIFLLLAVVVMIPFLLFGERFEERFSVEGTRDWLAGWGLQWGWLAALLLLACDLVLPIPATGVLSGLGYVYGTLAGGLIGAAGSFVSGWLGYALCRRFGERAAARLMGAEDRARGERLFAGQAGGWLVALSRCLPLLPEAVACMAGLTHMPQRKFLFSLAAGCLPMGFIFAAIGASGTDRPGMAIGLSILIPGILYAAALLIMRSLKRNP